MSTNQRSRRATSDVSAIRTALLASPLYAIVLGLASIAPPNVRGILLDRGWPPHATMILASVALAILFFKARALGAQRRAFGLELLPQGGRIALADAAPLVEQLEASHGIRGVRSFLVERVSRVLSQFASNGEVAEAAAANEAESDADAASIAASFSTVKVIVWSMPILGLIGTVVGLSGAVGAFSQAMSGAEELDAIKDSLRQVTTGLAVAFDATFVALIASIVVMLPMTWLQKAEDKLVGDVDDYCVTRVLPRLAKQTEAEANAVDQIAELALLAQPLAELLSANARTMDAMTEDRKALSVLIATWQHAIASLDRCTTAVGPTLQKAASELACATAVARESASASERAQEQLCRELGASRQLLSLLAAGLGPRHATASNGTNGSNGASAREG
jgi:biopolymer transport protein ExbB/TolQ